MPTGPSIPVTTDYHHHNDDSAETILQSVKQQEAQFEQLTRELEAERQSVATQLEKCKLGSETASMSSISVTDDSFRWRPPRLNSRLDDESDSESRASGSHLVDSCLRVLEERGLMGNIGEDPAEYLPDQPAQSAPYQPAHSVPYQQPQSTMNGSMYDRTQSPSHVTQRTVTTVTKVMTSSHMHSGSQSPLVDANYNDYPSYASYPNDPPAGNSMSQPPDNAAPYRTGDYHDASGFNGSTQYDESSYGPQSGSPYHGSYVAPRGGSDVSYAEAPYRDDAGYYDGMRPLYEDRPQYGDRYAPRPEERSPERSPRGYPSGGEPQWGYDSQPDGAYPEQQRGTPRADTANYPQESPYGSRPMYRSQEMDRPDQGPREGPYGSRPLYQSPELSRPDPGPQEGPYGSRPLYQSQELNRPEPGPQEGPYGSRPLYQSQELNRPEPGPQEGPYGSRPLYQSQELNRPEPGRQEGPYGSRPLYQSQELNRPDQGPQEGPYGSRPLYQSQELSRPDPGLQEGPYGSRPSYQSHEPVVDRFEAPPDSYQPAADRFAPDLVRQSPSLESDAQNPHWRNPDLPEVIEFLNHPSNAIKANAAAYLQHLCFMDDSVKAKTGILGGIPALVNLVNNEIPEVQRAACGALRNLSYGRANDDNKRSIKNASGIPALVRLLRKSIDNDVRELVTGILWNLSSCQDLKKPIIDDGLSALVSCVLDPHSGWDRHHDDDDDRTQSLYGSTVFRNGSGVLRNVSSAGEYARRKLRECEGLVPATLRIVRAAIGKNDIDNKSIENCVCLLRNLSYACQEVNDPEYHKRRHQPQAPTDGVGSGCFGDNKKKKKQSEQKSSTESSYGNPLVSDPGLQKMSELWQPDVVNVYLPLLADCTNPETLEAAAGAIQNLAACDWPPSEQIRAAVRKEKSLPVIVELLNLEADRVVYAAALALRNLALDQRNKELIGKYAMKQLVAKLPSPNREPDFPISDDAICAVEATLYEVIKKSSEFASSLLTEEGVQRLVHITSSKGKYSPKVAKFASSILYVMWQFKELHPEYRKHNLREQHFVTKTMAARKVDNRGITPPSSADNTLNRPRMGQSGPTLAGYNENTLPYVNRQPTSGPAYMDNYEQDQYGSRQAMQQPEDIMLNDLTLNPAYESHPGAGYYPSGGDHQRGMTDAYDGGPTHDDYRPPGGVPLFPNLPPGSQSQHTGEPLYAKVNRQNKRQQQQQQPSSAEGAGGVDSWV